jgi:hydroxypyruvate isomerase
MMRLAANLTMLFTEAPPLERPSLARGAGFDGVEILFPYQHSVPDWQAALDGLPLALINTPPGDWAAGERGWAAVPGQGARFREGFLQALDMARSLCAEHIHVMSGNAAGPEAEAELTQNLRWAAMQAPEQSLTLEPLNPLDMPGYFLSGFDQAARIIDGLGLPNLGLQLDLWHILRCGEDPAAIWRRHGRITRHVQISGTVGRAEPDQPALDWMGDLTRDYSGWIAAEYRPAAATAAGTGWVARARDALQA